MIYSNGKKIGALYINGKKIDKAYQNGKLVWQQKREVKRVTEIYLDLPDWPSMQRLYLESSIKSVGANSSNGYIDFNIAGRNVRARGAGGAFRGELDRHVDYSRSGKNTWKLTLPSNLLLTTEDLAIGDKLTLQINAPAVTDEPFYIDSANFSKGFAIFEESPFLPNSKLILIPSGSARQTNWKVDFMLTGGVRDNNYISKQFSTYSNNKGWEVEYTEEDVQQAMSYLSSIDEISPTFWIERLSGSALIGGVKLSTPALQYSNTMKIIKLATS